MAKRDTKPTKDKTTPVSGPASDATPEPPEGLNITLISLGRGTLLQRVHQSKYRADQFNAGTQGNARFSPIHDEHAKPIPTLYGGTTVDCALMETVFHDVPYMAGLKTVAKEKLADQVLSTVRIEQDLNVVDLTSVPLRKLGITRKQLIDTEKDQYPATRKWAMAIHRQCPEAQGLMWVSRQDDASRATVLFGDRISSKAIVPQGDSRSLLEDSQTYDAVLDLAERIGVNLVPGIT